MGIKLKKIDRVPTSLKELIDVDSSTGIPRCVDCISNGMILVADVPRDISKKDTFVFKNLTDIIKVGLGMQATLVNGVMTISSSLESLNLNDLLDVSITNPADDDVLTYNSVLQRWENTAGSWVPTSRTISINGVIQDLSANRSWTIPAGTGTVTSVTGTGTVFGLTLSGTVTTSGNLTLGGTLDVISALGFTPYNATNPAGYITTSALANYVTNSSLSSTLSSYVTSSTFSSTISGLSSIYQPLFVTDNGLTYSSATLKLGGDLTKNTIISGASGTYYLYLQRFSQLKLNADDGFTSTEILLTPTQMQVKTPLYGSASVGDVLTLQDPTTGEVEFQTPPSGSGGGPLYGAATQASAGVYTVTITGAPTYTAGDTYVIKFDTVNDGASTLNINGQGAKNIYKNTNFPIAAGDIKANQIVELVYDGTNFQAIGLVSNQILAYVSNDEGATISKGQAVYAYQASGDRMSVKLARADQDATSAKTIGLVYDTTIGVGASGYIIIQGVIEGVNTGSFSAGNTLYLSGSTFGGLTATKPSAPTHLVYVGIVERANPGNGQIYVRTQNGYELDEIHDVDLVTTGPVNNDVLVFDTSTTPDLWVPKSIPTILGMTTVGNNLATIPNPSAVSYIRIKSDNTVDTRTPAQVLTDLGVAGTIILARDYGQYSLTNTTTHTLVWSQSITANTLQTNDFIEWISQFNTNAANGTTVTYRIYINTSASLTGAQLLAAYSNGVGTGNIGFNRNIFVTASGVSGNLRILNSGISATSSYGLGSLNVSNITVDTTTTQHLIISIQHQTTAVTSSVQAILIRITR